MKEFNSEDVKLDDLTTVISSDISYKDVGNLSDLFFHMDPRLKDVIGQHFRCPFNIIFDPIENFPFLGRLKKKRYGNIDDYVMVYNSIQTNLVVFDTLIKDFNKAGNILEEDKYFCMFDHCLVPGVQTNLVVFDTLTKDFNKAGNIVEDRKYSVC